MIRFASPEALKAAAEKQAAAAAKVQADKAAALTVGEVWPLYLAISCPTLAIRGAESDLLTAATIW